MSNEVRKEAGISTVVTAAFIGGLAGALVGLLIAPKSGKELRQDIGNKAQDTWRELEEISQEKGEIWHSVREEVTREGRRLIEDLQTLVQELQRPVNSKKLEVAEERASED